MSSLGSRAAICRQSSEPIDPPAPVTKTLFPFNILLTAFKSMFTALLVIRSSTERFRISFTVTLSSRISRKFGVVLIGMLKGSSDFKRSRIVDGKALGIATTTSSILFFSITFGSASRFPKTGRPWMLCPTFDPSSSMKPTGS